MIRRLLILLALAGALIASPLAAQPKFPALSGRVVDNADILTPDVEARLTAKLEALETQSQRQLVVATIRICRATTFPIMATSWAAPGALAIRNGMTARC